MQTVLMCAGRELSRRPARTFGTVLGYALALGLMVVLGHLFLASDQAMRELMSGTGTHFMAFVPAKAAADAHVEATGVGVYHAATGPASLPHPIAGRIQSKAALDLAHEGFLANTIPTRVISQDVLQELKGFPDLIKDASPYLMFRLKEEATGALITIGGFDPANNQAVGSTCCAKGDLLSGEFLLPGDTGVVMLEQGFAQGRAVRVGEPLAIGGETLRVKGIVNPGVRPAKADIYLPFADAERIINKRLRAPLQREMNVILVEVTSALRQNAAIEKVKELLQAGIITSYSCYQPASAVVGINQRTFALLALFLALAVILLAMKSQYASIVERRHDFGILKALGWPDAVIFRQVLVEAFLQAGAGGLLGGAMGVVSLFVLPAEVMTAGKGAIEISPALPGFGLVFIIAAGLLAGYFPARRAVGETPADGIRSR
jgi:putative ABC transport system permease protein